MPRTAYTPSLPGLTADDDLDTVINWGLGVDSTAYLAEMLTGPAAYGIDLERTAVLYMATGSEWPETRLLVEEFMLPLLREHGVRFIQLARNGHLKADGFTVLDDSRHPQWLLPAGRGLCGTTWSPSARCPNRPEPANAACGPRAPSVTGGSPRRSAVARSGRSWDSTPPRTGDRAGRRLLQGPRCCREGGQ
ncbi:hypothetical protein [Streptomyces sp. NPDC057199]|uniref:hypothetical protein n=1 Tax=Streptomyces sp. NPDC057199 TaxID=3346047 RepID=UPI003634500B